MPSNWSGWCLGFSSFEAQHTSLVSLATVYMLPPLIYHHHWMLAMLEDSLDQPPLLSVGAFPPPGNQNLHLSSEFCYVFVFLLTFTAKINWSVSWVASSWLWDLPSSLCNSSRLFLSLCCIITSAFLASNSAFFQSLTIVCIIQITICSALAAVPHICYSSASRSLI